MPDTNSDMRAPRLLVDLRWMIPGQAGGLENVALSFLDRLFANRRYQELTLIIPGELKRQLRSAIPADVRLLVRDDLFGDLRTVIHRFSRGHLGRPILSSNYDVLYTLNGRIHPELTDIPALVMIPDLQHMALPELFDADDQKAREISSIDAARRAKLIVTISDFSRNEIIDKLCVSQSRISTTYLAADSIFDAPPAPTQRDSILARYGLLDRSYLLLPAQFWPHKNHATVIAALEHLAARGEAPPPLLVCTGSTDTPYGRTLLRALQRSPLASLVRVLGPCPRAELPPLYAGAEALIFCSLYEGFGMPVLEAMRMGCPVIASNSTSLPEVAGSAAILVNPHDPHAIATAVRRLRSNAALRSSLATAGRARAATFSWNRHHDEIMALVWAVAGMRAPQRYSPPGGTDFSLPPRETQLIARLSDFYYPNFRRIAIKIWRKYLRTIFRSLRNN